MSKRRGSFAAEKGSRKILKRSSTASVASARGSVVTGEMKYFDTNLTNTNITAVTGTWPAGTMVDPSGSINLGDAAVATPLNLCSPKVSSSLNGRIGRKIKVMKIRITGTVLVLNQATQNAADSPCEVRLLLVQDTQTNASQMTGAQLINDADSVTTNINAMQNPNNFGRFKVLKDKKFNISNMNMAGSPTTGDVIQSGKILPWKITKKFRKPVLVNFNATNGGTVADIIDNSFHVVCGTSSAAYVPAINYYSRVCYKE